MDINNVTRIKRSFRKNVIQKVDKDLAFVLHTCPWRETSLILEVFSKQYGRLMLVAKGAKRAHSKLRSVLLHFQPLQLSWRGKAEIKTLTQADWIGGIGSLHGVHLICAFYFNELLIKLMAQQDPHPYIFDHYWQALLHLNYHPTDQVLRTFELALLRELGHLPQLDMISDTAELLALNQHYLVDLQHGVYPLHGMQPEGKTVWQGKLLRAIQQEAWHEQGVLPAAKLLFRQLLQELLGTYQLKSRKLLIDLHQLA